MIRKFLDEYFFEVRKERFLICDLVEENKSSLFYFLSYFYLIVIFDLSTHVSVKRKRRKAWKLKEVVRGESG